MGFVSFVKVLQQTVGWMDCKGCCKLQGLVAHVCTESESELPQEMLPKLAAVAPLPKLAVLLQGGEVGFDHW